MASVSGAGTGGEQWAEENERLRAENAMLGAELERVRRMYVDALALLHAGHHHFQYLYLNRPPEFLLCAAPPPPHTPTLPLARRSPAAAPFILPHHPSPLPRPLLPGDLQRAHSDGHELQEHAFHRALQYQYQMYQHWQQGGAGHWLGPPAEAPMGTASGGASASGHCGGSGTMSEEGGATGASGREGQDDAAAAAGEGGVGVLGKRKWHQDLEQEQGLRGSEGGSPLDPTALPPEQGPGIEGSKVEGGREDKNPYGGAGPLPRDKPDQGLPSTRDLGLTSISAAGTGAAPGASIGTGFRPVGSMGVLKPKARHILAPSLSPTARAVLEQGTGGEDEEPRHPHSPSAFQKVRGSPEGPTGAHGARSEAHDTRTCELGPTHAGTEQDGGKPEGQGAASAPCDEHREGEPDGGDGAPREVVNEPSGFNAQGQDSSSLKDANDTGSAPGAPLSAATHPDCQAEGSLEHHSVHVHESEHEKALDSVGLEQGA